jgi:hypothetical protein
MRQRRRDETEESRQRRVDRGEETEEMRQRNGEETYLVLPTLLQRVFLLMNHRHQ